MGLNVCPAAIVDAPVEAVWALVAHPSRYGEWADAHIERIIPEGPASVGQIIYATSTALGKSWQITFSVEMVDPVKHQLRMQVTFPLGLRLSEYISCTPIDTTRCRVQYG